MMTAMDVIVVAAGFGAGVAIDMFAARFAIRAASDHCKSTSGTKLLSGGAGTLAALFAVWLAPPELSVFTAAFGWLLLALSNIDLRTQLLPDILNAVLLVLGASMVFLVRQDAWLMHVAGAGLGFAMLWAVETGYRRMRGRDGLGRGDAKLLGAIGVWVGATALPQVLLIASLSGLIAALIQSWLRRAPVSASTRIAFGPWIALGGFAIWCLHFAAPVIAGDGSSYG
jgi:prepilin signal peptidase PulO-like enzyme (type II secretory pathway)